VNQAIMHGGSQHELFADVCRLAVERGSIAAAWICWLDSPTESIETVASYSKGSGFADASSLHPDSSPGPEGTAMEAILEGKTVLYNDCGTGFFPLVFRGSPCGALCIKAEQPVFFRKREIALLEEIAMDISYTMDKLDADDGRWAAEEALQFSEYKYRTVVEHASDIIFTVDRAGRILFINKPPAPLSAEEAVGTDCVSYVDQEHRDLVRTEIERVFQSGEPGRFEIRSSGPNGTVAWYETRLSPPHGTGPLESIVLITQDITERKEAEEKLRLFKTVFDVSTEACAISDPSGLLVYVNKAHERLFGRSAEEAIRLNFRDFYPTDSIDILNREVEPALQRGEPWIGEMDVFTAGGLKFPLWERADSIHDSGGKLLYSFGFMHDISQRRRAEHINEAHLRLLQAESTCSLAELLSSAIDEAEALTGSRTGFFHFISPDQLTISLQAWSTNTILQMCKVEQPGTHYSMELAGVWVDSLRERRPVIHNDYASLPHRKIIFLVNLEGLRNLVLKFNYETIIQMNS
jgi:PAS domain S-box-containing protein